MRINTLCFIMLVVVRAPLCFKKEDVKIKICISRKQMVNQSNFYILYRMSERAIIAILTLLNFIWKEVTKLCFILVFMIKSLNSVMRSPTFISFRTLFSVSKFAKFRSVVIIISSFIFDRVKVITTLMIMRRISFRAFNSFKVT